MPRPIIIEREQMVKISPSLLSADFCRLGEAVEMLNASEADMIHADIMDGVFVPNISFGFPVLKAVGRVARKPLDVHLMIVDPGRYVTQVRDCGAALMNVHQEACTHLDRVVAHIKQSGMKAAVTLNPATPVEVLRDILPELDMVLLMSVNPGFAAQKYIPYVTAKIGRLRRLIEETGATAEIEIDGGVNLSNAPSIAAAGADILVAGNAVFSASDPIAAIAALRRS